MPSRWRATSSRIENARPSDCTPPRARSSASSSILGSLVGTSLAIETLPTETLRGVAGLSLVFGLVRDFTESTLQMGEANSIQAVLARQQRRATSEAVSQEHTTIAIDVQYYEK